MSFSKLLLFIGALLLPWLILFLLFGGMSEQDAFGKSKKRPYLIQGFIQFSHFVFNLPLLFIINVLWFLFIVLPFVTPLALAIMMIMGRIELNFITLLLLLASLIWMLFTYTKLEKWSSGDRTQIGYRKRIRWLTHAILSIKKENLSKRAKDSSDKHVICHYCNGYGELATKDKRQEEGTTCPHCLGTGWVAEK